MLAPAHFQTMTIEDGLLMLFFGLLAILIASVIGYFIINMIEKKRTEVDTHKHLDKF
tara:strand:- start:207 stop:377 length:171 start_codon:yes stop_codon:yes gene_type:complete